MTPCTARSKAVKTVWKRALSGLATTRMARPAPAPVSPGVPICISLKATRPVGSSSVMSSFTLPALPGAAAGCLAEPPAPHWGGAAPVAARDAPLESEAAPTQGQAGGVACL
eukprot:CAMPEP_0119102160 /NCGR_PEP_ID=MMETSP1180-20130426/1010_1 /TAXON_ID=3052 ORGANISM="Chlamydomonas cf sp, Strain CCMP681" /NCGR_SAMPLE_ID=MMETSP1180 /ASSEMBLY_ACC=CAM_ASM_000741 /LENGTH=111 /DNA_ID=CAMNT_0007086403 /DNA_START=807 /DNA_END=1143 /DNA_ORIENTATION=+